MTRKFWGSMILGGCMGYVMYTIGQGPDTWQFWAVLVLQGLTGVNESRL